MGMDSMKLHGMSSSRPKKVESFFQHIHITILSTVLNDKIVYEVKYKNYA